MLLGVAQIVLNVARLDEEAQPLLERGFEQSFDARGLANHPAKAAFQAAPRERLDMAHFAAPDGGLAVELTAYEGAPPAGAAPYTVRWTEKGAVDEIAAPAGDQSGRFWTEGIGFRTVADDDGVLEFRALMPSMAARVRLSAEPSDEPSTVDAEGCVLVTMLSTALDDDLARLGGSGLLSKSTEPWDEDVGGRTVRVAMLAGPAGELVELLQVPRQ